MVLRRPPLLRPDARPAAPASWPHQGALDAAAAALIRLAVQARDARSCFAKTEGHSMIVVHHLNNSRSQRVLWLLEELGLDYELKRYERDPVTMLAPPSLRAVHPLGKSPVITDGELTLAESGAIIEYLVDRYGEGRLTPGPGSPERLRYTYWL